MLDHPQFEYFQKRKLDPKNDTDYKLIEEFWCANLDEVVDGLRFRTKVYQK